MKRNTWTKERYEQVVFLAYSGFTGMLINEKMGTGNACSNLNPLRLNLAIIRKRRREGVSLEGILEGIDWSFLKAKEESRREANKMIAPRAKTAKSRAKSAEEIQETLTLVRELHALLCKPNAAVKEATAA